MLAGVGCHKSEAPQAVVAVDAAPASPGPAPVRDAAFDVADARDGAADASDAGVRHGHRVAKKPAVAGGGGGGVKVDGKLPQPAAEKVVHAGVGALRACYDADHAKSPSLGGKVTFRLAVDDGGRVTLGEVVTSTLGGGDPEMCMVRVARDFRFPAGNGESTVSFQMSFGR